MAAPVQSASRRKITIGLVLPNRNHARFLSESLSSVARQTRPPDEFIVIDDGSTDDSVAVVERFRKQHPAWRLIRHAENRGVVARINEGMQAVSSDWYVMLAADDLEHPQFLEIAAAMAERHSSAGMVCGCVQIFGPKGGRRLRPPILPRLAEGYVSPDEFRRLLDVGDNYFVGTVAMYRRQVLLDLGGFDEALGSICDGYMGRQIAARHGFYFVPKVLGYWRMHGENYSLATVTDPKKLEHGIKAVRAALQKEPAGMFPADYADTLERRLRFGGVRVIVMDRQTLPEERAARIAALLHSSPREQRALTALMSAGLIGSAIALAWLTLRLRPLSLWRLIRHFPMRRSIQRTAKTALEVRIESLKPR